MKKAIYSLGAVAVLSLSPASLRASAAADFVFGRTTCDFGADIYSAEGAGRIFAAMRPSTETIGESSITRNIFINNGIDRLELSCASAAETVCAIRYHHHLWNTTGCTQQALPAKLDFRLAAESSATISDKMDAFTAYLLGEDGHFYRWSFGCRTVVSPLNGEGAPSCALSLVRVE